MTNFLYTAALIVSLVTMTENGVLFAQNGNNHVPSKERADVDAARKTDIDGNLVRTTIFNYGLTGRTGGTPGEIPCNIKGLVKRGIVIGGISIAAHKIGKPDGE